MFWYDCMRETRFYLWMLYPENAIICNVIRTDIVATLISFECILRSKFEKQQQ